MPIRTSRALLFLPFLLLISCSRKPPADEVGQITSEFVYEALALSPSSATQTGYHEHKGTRLDGLLDDVSAEGIAKQKQFYERMKQRLDALKTDSLPAADRADVEMMKDATALNLLELDVIHNYRHNPTFYVELIGNALFSVYVLNYAPMETRYQHLVSRLNQIPVFPQNARKNLTDAPEVWKPLAREENAGTIGLIDKTLRAAAPPAHRAGYDKAAAGAIAALREFNTWLEKDLSKRTSDWRLGKEKYAAKFKYVLGLGRSPEEVLKDAEASLEAVRKQMADLAGSEGVQAALTRIAERHATPSTYFGEARRDLDEVRRFVREKQLVTLPLRDNLSVIETPEFMRGIYSVGGFNSAPPLEPQLGAFYWLTPIPENWPADRVESKLREYNFFGLKLLTIHEAMPGHYVQIEFANEVQPPARRLLRSIFGNGPYVEGWAVYITEAVLDAGYLGEAAADAKALRLTFLKQQLRMIANAILDVRLQTMNMTDQEALTLMLGRTYQEKEEAVAKLQRAKLSSTQLPTYYAGYREWMKLRDQRRGAVGADFRLLDFHDKAIRVGAVPMRLLASVME